MAGEQINFNLDAVDDVLLGDGVPSFEGGQFSNLRANLLQQNASKLLGNCDVERLGRLRTRRGTIVIGPDANPQPDPGVTTAIQGLTSYQCPDANYIVAVHNKKLWKWVAPAWVQIGLGGVRDNAEILIYREGAINQSTVSTSLPEGGYGIGATKIEVNGLPAVTAPILAADEKLYFKNNLRTDYYEYTIKSFNPTGGTVTPGGPLIILEEPGLVFPVKHAWGFVVARPARINNGAGYPALHAGAMTIDGYGGAPAVGHGGEVAVGEEFVIRSENKKHTVTAASGGPPTTSITGTVALQADWVALADVPVVFAQGLDMLFFCDGLGPIYGWKETADGGTLMNLSALNTVDYLTGSSLGRAATAPPTACHVLLWFQNRLIASGIAADPDAIFFSDFFDATSWDRNYQLVRIGGGESDPITGCLAWTDLNMLVFKKNSCYLINLDPSQNPNPDDPTLLVASFAVKQLHKLIGCPAPNTAVQVGGGSTTPGSDVFFVDGDKKVHSIRRVMAAETQQEVGQAMSLPVQDVLDTINILNIHLSVAMYHNEHYILGFPSMRGQDGGTHNNACLAYNLLTQSWCGVWSWAPTCFARRTDLGAYSKLILGDYRIFPAGGGRVLQWMDDLSLDEETTTTYQELVPNVGAGRDIPTQILTRAFTGGDLYSYKTGLNVEFEFDESVAGAVTVDVILDKVRHPTSLAETRDNPSGTFSTLSEPRLRLPFRIPISPPEPELRLPASPSIVRKAFDLQRYGTWRELQFLINSSAGKLAIRSIRLSYFSDTMRLQTIPTPPGEVFEPPPTLPSF